jgi:hypothetical protein
MHIAPEQLDGFYSHSVFKSLSYIHVCWCLVMDMNILAPKIWTLQIGTEKQNCDHLENVSDDYD